MTEEHYSGDMGFDTLFKSISSQIVHFYRSMPYLFIIQDSHGLIVHYLKSLKYYSTFQLYKEKIKMKTNNCDGCHWGFTVRYEMMHQINFHSFQKTAEVV